MIACFLGNISAKYYKNPSVLSRVIAKNVGMFFSETQCTSQLKRSRVAAENPFFRTVMPLWRSGLCTTVPVFVVETNTQGYDTEQSAVRDSEHVREWQLRSEKLSLRMWHHRHSQGECRAAGAPRAKNDFFGGGG